LMIFLWRCGPTRAMTSSFLRFLDHTQWSITVGRTPLDEWSARRRDLYLTTHNTHNRQISMPRWDSNPRSQHKVCVLILFTAFVWNSSHSKKKWARQIKKYISLRVTHLLFSTDFRKILSNFTKFRPVGDKVLHANGRTEGQIWRS